MVTLIWGKHTKWAQNPIKQGFFVIFGLKTHSLYLLYRHFITDFLGWQEKIL
jgi:hypothetical protein